MANALSLIDGEYPRRILSPGTSLVPTNDVGRTGYKPNFTMGGPPAGAGSPDPFGEEAVRRAREAAASRRAAPPPAAPTSAPAPVSTPRPTLRQGLASANPTVLGKASYLGGRAGAATAKALGPPLAFAGRAAVGADVISHFNDYKIDDPEVDSSARGTWNALKQGDFSGAGRSLSKGMLETGMDLGSFAANTLDYVVPGKAPVSRAYDSMLRSAFGDQLTSHPSVDNEVGRAPTKPSLAYQPDPTDQRLAAGTQRSPLGGPSADDPKPASSPGNQIAPGAFKHGRGEYSDSADGMGFGSFTGRPNAQNMAAADALADRSNAESVARLRGAGMGGSGPGSGPVEPGSFTGGYSGVIGSADTYGNLRGRSPEQQRRDAEVSAGSIHGPTAARGKAQLAALEARHAGDVQAGTERYKADQNLRGNMYTADSSRESYGYTADQKLKGDVITAQASLRNNRARMQYDMAKDQRNYNLDVERYGLEKANAALKQRESSEKVLREQLLGQLPQVRDKDGKMVPDEQGAAQYMRAAYARLASRENELRTTLQKDPNNAQAAAELESLRHYGLGALSADPAANNKFMTGMQARNDARSNASWWNPASADRGAGATSKPITSLKWDDGSLLDGYRDQDGNWIPEHVIDQGGDWFGARNGKYDNLKVK